MEMNNYLHDLICNCVKNDLKVIELGHLLSKIDDEKEKKDFGKALISIHLNYGEQIAFYINKGFVNKETALEYFKDYLKALHNKYTDYLDGYEELKKLIVEEKI